MTQIIGKYAVAKPAIQHYNFLLQNYSTKKTRSLWLENLLRYSPPPSPNYFSFLLLRQKVCQFFVILLFLILASLPPWFNKLLESYVWQISVCERLGFTYVHTYVYKFHRSLRMSPDNRMWNMSQAYNTYKVITM